MAGIIKTTQREYRTTVAASAPAQRIIFNAMENKFPNVFQITNYGAQALFIGTLPTVSALKDFIISIPGGGGSAVYTDPSSLREMYLYSLSDANIIIKSWAADEVFSSDLYQTLATTIINSVLTSSVTLAAALPAGTNKIGVVDIENMPAIALSNVDIASLPELPAGDNNIGNVDVVTLPSIPAGNNNIGDVDVTTIAAGQVVKPGTAPNIYNITMTSANTEYSQALPAGCKKIFASIQDADTSVDLRFAFVTGKVATPTAPYYKYNGGVELIIDGLEIASGTLYFACSGAGKIMQIIAIA